VRYDYSKGRGHEEKISHIFVLAVRLSSAENKTPSCVRLAARRNAEHPERPPRFSAEFRENYHLPHVLNDWSGWNGAQRLNCLNGREFGVDHLEPLERFEPLEPTAS
jgi:hypothetical protein